MSTVNVVISKHSPVDEQSIINSVPQHAENVTTSGTSAKATNTIAGPSEVWAITPLDADVYAKFGDSDVEAAAGSDWLLMTGVTYYFRGQADAQYLALIDPA